MDLSGVVGALVLVATVSVLRVHSMPVERSEADAGSKYNPGLFEGDIAGPLSAQAAKNGILDSNYLWKYRTVFYNLTEEFNEEEVLKIDAALEQYHRKTCLRFFSMRNTIKPHWIEDYVYITRANTGCWSYVGRQGWGRQELNLQSPGCMSRGTIIHEFMHAVGFWHEQSRPDRDLYITINETNVSDGLLHNFLVKQWNETTALNAPYDVESVMHYDAYAFAKDRNIPTIVSNQPGQTLGNDVDFTQIDVMKIDRLYGCS